MAPVTPSQAPVLYERSRRVRDRTLRCYLTLSCTRACPWCSAGVPQVATARRKAWIEPGQWAEGINRRGRATILAGGEPLLYEGFADLLDAISPAIPIEIYTNLEPDVTPLVQADRPLKILASLHRDIGGYSDPWFEHLAAVRNAGHAVRGHVVKAGRWQERIEWLAATGIKTTCCGDQRSGVRSAGTPPREVWCTNSIYLFGPDGRRYPCVTLLGVGESKLEHITEPDSTDSQTIPCDRFGRCVGCDNNIEGRSAAIDNEEACLQ